MRYVERPMAWKMMGKNVDTVRFAIQLRGCANKGLRLSVAWRSKAFPPRPHLANGGKSVLCINWHDLRYKKSFHISNAHRKRHDGKHHCNDLFIEGGLTIEHAGRETCALVRGSKRNSATPEG